MFVLKKTCVLLVLDSVQDGFVISVKEVQL